MCDSFDQPKYQPSYLPASGVPVMHLEPAEGLQIGGGRGQSLIQGLFMEQVYASTKMVVVVGSITPGPETPRIQWPWPLIKVVFPVIKATLSFTLEF